jgi:hypothetical protein
MNKIIDLISTYRTGRMKKARKSVYITQFIITIILIVLFTILTPKSSFSPLYLPFELYFFIIAIMLLMANAESIFFKLFGIKWSRTDSEKFLLSKDYMKKGIIIAVAAILIIGVVNFLVPAFDESIDTSETLVFTNEHNITFMAQDAFAISGVKKITVASVDETPIPINIFILREKDLRNREFDMRFNLADYESRGITELTFERQNFLSQGSYALYMEAQGEVVKITYTIERSVASTFVPYFTIFPLVFAALNGGWVVYLFPKRKRYGKTSIYE